ncbi:ellis-van Creveld syndrome protein [Arapaima gigas]
MRRCDAGSRLATAGLDLPTPCAGDVLLGAAQHWRVAPGLLTLAVALGALLGLAAAALLFLRLSRSRLAPHGWCIPRRRFMTGEVDADADRISAARKAARSNGKMETKLQSAAPTNSDVAAFALKAKVVYPINQRYRPLADGASNPSLHENSKLGPLHPPESLSSSSLGSLSQENDEDDSSQLVFPSPVPRSLQNERFSIIGHFPESLCCPGFEGRISLYCLGLQSFQQLSSELLEQKHTMFLQVLRIIFNEWFHKEKIDSAFYSNVLLVQERELEELKNEASGKRLSAERSEDCSSGHSTLEDMERAGRHRQEYILQMAVGFSRQLERLCQRLQDRPSAPPKEGLRDMTHVLFCSLLLVEKGLAEVQNSHMKRLQEKMLWWEELVCWLPCRAALLRQEAVCGLRLVAKALEQLTSEGQLSFSHMEKMLSDLQGVLREDLQSCSEAECINLTKELVTERCRKTEMKRKKLTKAQVKERSRTLDTAAHHKDPQEFVKVHQALLLRQRKEGSDLEDQQDGRTAEAVCELWKKVHLSWSEKLAERLMELFRTSLPEQAGLPHDRCKQVAWEVERELGAQRCYKEAVARQHLTGLREQLEQDRQMWAEEVALVSASLAHLTDQQLRILRGMMVRQRDLQESGPRILMEEKQRLLLASLRRHFVARHFDLRTLKEMRLSRLKLTSQYDCRAVELDDCRRSHHTLRTGLKEPGASEAEKRQATEAVLIGQGFQQEFLSELDTGSEFLQEHAQLLVGHALAHSVRQRFRTKQPRSQLDDRRKQVELMEAASESVYVTRDSINTLIQNYYTQIQTIMRNLQQDQQSFLQDLTVDKQRNQLTWTLQKELANWARKPSSVEFQQRVEIQKKNILSRYDLDLEATCDRLRKKSSLLDQMRNCLEEQLQEAEESFLSRLAATARVPPASRGSSHVMSAAETHSGEDKLHPSKITSTSDTFLASRVTLAAAVFCDGELHFPPRCKV